MFAQKLQGTEQRPENPYDSLLEFGQAAAHDLKAPLRRINQYCELLKEETGDKLGKDGNDYVDRIGINARRLYKLIDDLFDYSRIINDQEEEADISLEKIIAGLIDEFDPLLRESNATIVLKRMPVIRAYPQKIRGLFRSLIKNALLYKGEKDPVVTISWEETDEYHILSVQDNGPGIEHKFHEVIFSAFERLHTQDDIEGSGLGLSLSRKIAEIHGGDIWVESSPGEGSSFRFAIPKAL